MVAMLGWIIPAPFATPAMLTSFSPMGIFAEAIFGRVSVVRMAPAKARSATLPAAAFPTSAGSAAMIFSEGNGTPMMPVEDGNTWCGLRARPFANARQVSLHVASPSGPVAQFALPEFTSTARMV